MVPYKKIMMVLIILALSSVHAGPGDAGAAFLRIPVDARVVGMGEAGCSYVNNATALYYNPAGLANIGKFNVSANHNEWLLGMNHEYIGAGFGLENIGTFGIALNYWGSGSIQGITIRGDTIPGYYFSAYDWSLNSGFGREFGSLALGVGVKFISEKSESLSGSALGCDFGGIYRLPLKGMSAGLSISNLGTGLKLDQESFSLPVMIRLGWKYNLKNFGITQDFIFSNSDKFGLGIGVEYIIAEILALRSGYRTADNYEGLAGLRAGFGIVVRGLVIDYGVAPYGRLGFSHRITISFTRHRED